MQDLVLVALVVSPPPIIAVAAPSGWLVPAMAVVTLAGFGFAAVLLNYEVFACSKEEWLCLINPVLAGFLGLSTIAADALLAGRWFWRRHRAKQGVQR